MKRTLTAILRAAALGLLLAAITPGCSSLLDVDGYQKSSIELCDLLESCFAQGYQGCRGHVDDGLDAASSADRSEWLSAFVDNECTRQCSSARKCLDRLPVCNDTNEPCNNDEDCCQFLGGLSACKNTKTCCRPKGVACSGHADCCDDELCISGTCGGTQCKVIDAFCKSNGECCSKRCDPNTNQCVEGCLPDGFSCSPAGTDNADCCSNFCSPEGYCGKHECGRVGEGCDAGTPCCTDPVPLSCVPTSDPNKGVCNTEQCLPVDAPCLGGDCCAKGDDTDLYCASSGTCALCRKQGETCEPGKGCCGTLVCNPVDSTCTQCLQEGQPCDAAGQCCQGSVCDQVAHACKACSTSSCKTSADCCGGVQCIGGACQTQCQALDCTHTPCQSGGPLQQGACGADANVDSCINIICNTGIDPKTQAKVTTPDPYCCCQGWDALCAKTAAELAVKQGVSHCKLGCGL